MKGGMHHRANAGLGSALHARTLFLQLVERGAPAFLRTCHHRRGDRRVDESEGLHHVHARSAERVRKIDFGIGADSGLPALSVACMSITSRLCGVTSTNVPRVQCPSPVGERMQTSNGPPTCI